ncbi:hypothetical protein [Carnobacterium sp.]|uniref:hypothetical protein n=1 Tax=Carnobacterium sp. TaxID=48221 RepID=UPI0028AFA3A1|nr:hypothetical protein [Carnobacterium sp.]
MKKSTSLCWMIGLLWSIFFVLWSPEVYGQTESVTNQYASKDSADSVVDKKADLPEIYQNTKIYNGMLSFDRKLSYEIKNQEGTMTDIPVNKTGKFAVDFGEKEFKVGDTLIFHIISDEPAGMEETIEKQILPATAGKEVIYIEAGSSEEKELEANTVLPTLYPYTKHYMGTTVPGSSIRLLINTQLSDQIQADAVTGEFTLSFDDQELQTGQVIQFILLSNGITHLMEKMVSEPTEEWKKRVAEIKQATELPDIYQNMGNYAGKTISEATITLNYRDQLEAESTADKNGNFIFDLSMLTEISAEDSLEITITDTTGVFATFEKVVLLEKSQADNEEQVSDLEIGEENKLPEVDEHQESLTKNESQKKTKDKQRSPLEEITDKTHFSLLPDSTEPGKTAHVKNEGTALPESENETILFSSAKENTEVLEKSKNEAGKSADNDSTALMGLVVLGTLVMSAFLYKY